MPVSAEIAEVGRLTVPEAVELVGCFWLAIADHVPMNPESGEELFGGSGSNQAVTLGGVDQQARSDRHPDVPGAHLGAVEPRAHIVTSVPGPSPLAARGGLGRDGRRRRWKLYDQRHFHSVGLGFGNGYAQHC